VNGHHASPSWHSPPPESLLWHHLLRPKIRGLPYDRPKLLLLLLPKLPLARGLPLGRHRVQLQVHLGQDRRPGCAVRTAVALHNLVAGRIAVARHILAVGYRTLDAKAADHRSLAHNHPAVDHSPADAADGLRHMRLVVLDTAPDFGSHLAGSVVRTGPDSGLGRMIDLAGRNRLDRRVQTSWMVMEAREKCSRFGNCRKKRRLGGGLGRV